MLTIPHETGLFLSLWPRALACRTALCQRAVPYKFIQHKMDYMLSVRCDATLQRNTSQPVKRPHLSSPVAFPYTSAVATSASRFGGVVCSHRSSGSVEAPQSLFCTEKNHISRALEFEFADVTDYYTTGALPTVPTAS